MKRTAEQPYSDPEAAKRKLVELAATIESVQNGRIHIGNQRAIPLRAQSQRPGGRRRHQMRCRERLARVAQERDLRPAHKDRRRLTRVALSKEARHSRRAQVYGRKSAMKDAARAYDESRRCGVSRSTLWATKRPSAAF